MNFNKTTPTYSVSCNLKYYGVLLSAQFFRDVTTCGIPGLNPPAHKCLAVTFHVLVPIKLWEWTDESRIHLVFGNAKLGKWKEPVGEFGAPKR